MGARLFINLSYSRCGACDGDALPTEYGHFTKVGYHPGEGCGEWWTSVSSDYAMSHEWLLNTDQFPNLLGLPVYEVFEGYVGRYGSLFTNTSFNMFDADNQPVHDLAW